jgi:undecaprenyl-diphosphatase
VCLALLVGLTTLVYSGRLNDVDQQLLTQIVSSQTTRSLSFWHVITWAGEPFVAVGVGVGVALLLYAKHKTSNAKFMAIAILSANVLETPFKYLVHRARPLEMIAGTMPNSFSFPSGHAFFATALYVSLAVVFARNQSVMAGMLVWLLAAALVALVLLSRLCLGVHFPSDVLGGLLSGLACVLFANWMVKPDASSRA